MATTTETTINQKDNEDDEDESCSSDNDEEVRMVDYLFERGSRLRALRELERRDEEERHNDGGSTLPSLPPCGSSKNNGNTGSQTTTTTTTTPGDGSSRDVNDDHDDDCEDTNGTIIQLSNRVSILNYDSFLREQRLYDDLKHVDCTFIDYGIIGGVGSYGDGGVGYGDGSYDDHTSSKCIEQDSTCKNDNTDDDDDDDRSGGRLIIEQDKSVGKGGLCWDAAFILGEHIIHNVVPSWSSSSSSYSTSGTCRGQRRRGRRRRIIELGCGTGLCGMMIAKAVRDVDVHLTDLPELQPLLRRNVTNNFTSDNVIIGQEEQKQDGCDVGVDSSTRFDVVQEKYAIYNHHSDRRSYGRVSPYVLEWGMNNNQSNGTNDDDDDDNWDLIIGADIVATLYDPIALVSTIDQLVAGAAYNDDDDNNNHKTNTMIYISFKERLSSLHRSFEKMMIERFHNVEILDPQRNETTTRQQQQRSSSSRNRNPDVRILMAWGKKKN